MKNSDSSSAASTATSASPRKQFRLTGPSAPLEGGRFAVRRDLAEIAVADRIFAQHYAEPMPHRLTRDTIVHRRAQADADARGSLLAGDLFHVLDLGQLWAWGRGDAGPVGYVEVAALERVDGGAAS